MSHDRTSDENVPDEKGGPPERQRQEYNEERGRDRTPAVPTEVVITFDQPDEAACAIPATIATMKVVLNTTVEVAALQAWAVQYEFLP